MKQIIIKTPAKINLTLEVLDKRKDGYHNIRSVMHAINLYDILKLKVEKSRNTEIVLKGNSPDIPYDERNLVYKATKIFLDKIKLTNVKIEFYIEKNIPITAGLAGGSANASGALLGLNRCFDEILNNTVINELASQLGSVLNFCLQGGCALCTGRGEILICLLQKENHIIKHHKI